MFKTKEIDIDTGPQLVAVLNKRDVEKLQLHTGERIEIHQEHTPHKVTCVLEVLDKNIHDPKGELDLKVGEIGLLEEAFRALKAKEGIKISIRPIPKALSFQYAKQKLEEGKKLGKKEFYEIIRDMVDNEYSDAEMTYFVLACAEKGLTDEETVHLTRAMIDTGQVLKLKKKIVADKHCIGGIPGNRTTPIVVAIAAVAGIAIPNTFTRAITSPAGTADTLEVYLDVDVDLTKMKRIVEKINGCLVWGGSLDMAPSDDIIIRIEHPIHVDSENQMIASILAKKISAGNTHCLLDIPLGKAAKVTTKAHAIKLKNKFERIAKKLGLNLKVVITDGNQPIGHGVGPLLEMIDVLKVLKNDPTAPQDLLEKSLYLTGELLNLVGKTKGKKGYQLAKEILESGEANRKFEEICKAQGKRKLPQLPNHTHDVKSSKKGKIKAINNKVIVQLAKICGAPMDYGAGVFVYKFDKDKVEKGEALYRLYSSNEYRLKNAVKYLKKAGNGYTIN